jgi:hypothetical protein
MIDLLVAPNAVNRSLWEATMIRLLSRNQDAAIKEEALDVASRARPNDVEFGEENN